MKNQETKDKQSAETGSTTLKVLNVIGSSAFHQSNLNR